MLFVPPGAQLAASRVLTTVSKLKPKSMPETVAPLVLGSTLLHVWVVVAAVVPGIVPVVCAASTNAGLRPPTSFVTVTSVPAGASTRYVCTATHVVQVVPPLRSDRTVPFTTRMRRSALPVYV